MKSFAIAPVLVASAAAVLELPVQKRDRHNNGATTEVARSVLVERSGTLGTNIYDVLSWSAGGAYYVNVTVGTPPQNQIVILDTGSSDLYFDASTAPECQTSGATSCQGGTFNPKDSSTYKVVEASPAFNTSFGDGSTASGPYSTDVFAIGDVTISNVQFGVATNVNSTTGYAIGLMGVGYSYIEATQNPYANVPEVLVDAGVINSRLYSVFLNDESDISGSILFGGIDTSKYSGELVTFDLLPDEFEGQLTGQVDQFITVVTGVSATGNGKSKTFFSNGPTGIQAYNTNSGSLPVLLDTGSTAWSVPQTFYEESIAPLFSYVDNQGLCDCKYASSSDSVTLEFGGKLKITVPAREFIVPYIDTTTKQPVNYPGTNDQACVFLIQPAAPTGEGFQTLGDAILRSMYLVYDLDNGQVSIAQAATNSGSSSNVVEVPAGAGGVAKAVSSVSTAPANSFSIAPAVATNSAAFSVSTLSSALGTATGEAAIPTSAQVSGQVVATASGGSGSGSGSSGSTSSPKSAAAGPIAPGAGFGALCTTGVAFFFAVLGASIML